MFEVYRRLYPDTGYAYDSRGSAEDLRTDIDIEKVNYFVIHVQETSIH